MKTTRETARQESHKKVTHSLQDLLEKNYDAEKEYKSARENAKTSSAKDFFQKQAVRKNHYATEIDQLLHSLNEHPKEPGSVLGAINRTWINLKSALGKNSDQVLLEECLRGEMNSLNDYEHELSKANFPPKIEDVLRNHLAEMRKTLSEIKSVEDLNEI